ncbi:MAG: DUF624 domain-containing protein [Eubacterium sp.]|nr:DUF624 domain-containing protein [Eubacterium sp.]
MSSLLGGFLSNDSTFGRIMARIWVIVAANILFVLCTVPVVTAGPAFAALHFTIMKMLRGDLDINPFSTFWEGLKTNFKQAVLTWLVLLALAVMIRLEWFWCGQFGGVFQMFQIGLAAIAGAAVVIGLYMFPTMAAFKASLKEIMKDSLFFAFRKPLYLIVVLFFSIFPMFLTFMDVQMLPLYAFVWVTCGFSLVCLVTDTLLLREFEPYLPKVDEYGNIIEEQA